eukprot:COSAG01_NODE_17514_length_1144_cov_1.674641_2_plen_57_part_00
MQTYLLGMGTHGTTRGAARVVAPGDPVGGAHCPAGATGAAVGAGLDLCESRKEAAD